MASLGVRHRRQRNAGQYPATLREAGLAGAIVSFEPLEEAFARFQERADDRFVRTSLSNAVRHAITFAEPEAITLAGSAAISLSEPRAIT